MSKRLDFLIAFLLLFACSAKATVTLRFSTWDGDVALKILHQIAANFEKIHPDIKIEIESIPDYNSYHQKMVVEYAANAAPDVAMMDPGHFMALSKRGALTPLNQFFNQIPGFDIKNYYKPIVDAHTYHGALYVLPRDIAPEGLIYYNKKIFREAGIPYPDGSWTWDFKERPELKEKDFWWVVDKLTKFDSKGKPVRFGYLPAWDQLLLNTFAYSYGLRFTDNAQDPTKVLTDSPGWIKIGNFIHDIVYNKKWAPSQTTVSSVLQSNTDQLFIQGKAAMYQNGIWEVPNIRRYMSPSDPNFFDWDIAMFPRYVGGKLAMPTGGSGYAIFSSCKHKKEAWEWLTYAAGPPGMTLMAKAGIAQPAMRSVALTSAWLPTPQSPLAEQYPHNRIITDTAVPSVVFDPTSDYWPDVFTLWTSKMDNYFNGLEPADKALKGATDIAQSRLDYLRQQKDLPKFNWAFGAGIGGLIFLALLAWVYKPEVGKKYTSRQRSESKVAYKFLTPWLIGLVCLTVGPMLLSLLMSTTDWDMIQPARFRGFGNFIEAATIDPRFWVSLKVTMIYTLVRVPLGLFFAGLLALLLNQKVKGVPIYRACFYVPTLVSGVASSLIWRKMFAPDDGLINAVLYSKWVNGLTHVGDDLSRFAGTPGQHVNWLGNEKTALASFIFMSVWGVGGAMIILLAGMQGIPDMFYEAATVDGATPWIKTKVVTLPLLTPAIFFTLVTGLIGAFQDFTSVYVITSSAGGPNNATMLYMLNLYKAGFESYRFGYVAALAWVLFVIILLFTVLQFKTSKWVYYESDLKS